MVILWTVEFKTFRKKPGDKAFWDSFKFPRLEWDQRLSDFNNHQT